MTPVPLYRLYGNGDHFYTMSAPERDSAVAGGYTYEGVACYVMPDAAPIAAEVPPLPAPYSMRDMFAASVMAQFAMQAAQGQAAILGGSTQAIAAGAGETVKVARELACAAYAYADALMAVR